ncbi:MAG: hypothetical protein KGQ59_11265 [Bdellovibrionales bacterium]|nr:hypothetical protein [Bdellovibrionales bacterium]
MKSELPSSPDRIESWLEAQLGGKNRLWSDHATKRSLWRYYCPFCSVSRSLKAPPKPGMNHFFQILLTTLMATAVLWPWFGARGLFLILPFWMIFEISYRVRVRVELRCDQCGFDPTLYLADVALARKEMEDFWKKKLENPSPNAKVASPPAESESEPIPSLTAEKPQS